VVFLRLLPDAVTACLILAGPVLRHISAFICRDQAIATNKVSRLADRAIGGRCTICGRFAGLSYSTRRIRRRPHLV